MISEKNTKKEIMEAYLQQQETILRLEKEMEMADAKKEVESEKPKLSIVIPYVKEFAQGNELHMAVRSWNKFFKEEFNLVVIGDREPWMNDQLTLIEHKRVGNNPPIDIAHKMELAIKSDKVSEKFVWSNDDQYLVGNVMLADLEFLKCTGLLKNKLLSTSQYHTNKKKTYDALMKQKAGIWDFSAHFPFVYEKKKLAELIEIFNLKKESYLISTLYFNLFFPGFYPYNIETQQALEYDNLRAGVYRRDADLSRLKRLIPRKKVVGNSQAGWSKELQKIITEILPEKCRFEN